VETKAKSLFVILHSVDRSSSKVYELKIQPGGQVIGVGKGGRSETRDDYESQLLLEPVAYAPCHSIVESARMFNSSKLFLWLNERLNNKPSNGSVFDMVTKSLVPFKPSPKAHKGPSTVISAYGKLYYLANPDCVPEAIPKPSFQRYDPATNRWKTLSPFPDYSKRYWYRKRVEGYAVCYGFILFSTADRVVKYIVYDITRNRWYKDVKEWQRAEHVSHESIRGRAVVVGDTIYAFSIFWRTVIFFNFWWDVDMNGEFTFYVSPQSALRGLEINRAFLQISFGCFEEPKEGYLAHLGNLDFCLVQTHMMEETTLGFKIKHDGRQELCITTFQVVAEGGRRRRIKTLHSTICEVEIPNSCPVHLGPSFTPDCDDNEPTEEEERVTTWSMPLKVKQFVRDDEEDEETIAPKKMKTELN
jgi:hypothetical protein